jgi:hypothetical protein
MPTRRRKKIKYRKVMLKLSPKQNRSLENYCKARRTTPGRLIKKVIRPYLAGYDKQVPEEYYVSERQLDLFEEPSTP